MADVMYCDICKEHDELTRATIAFRIQREPDTGATPQHVCCCDRHEGHAAVAAAYMRSHLAPAAVFRVALSSSAAQQPSL